MNIVLPFVASETNQAVRWLRWVLEYCGFQERQHLWLLPFKGIDAQECTNLAKESFKEVDVITDALGVVSDWQTGVQWRDSRGPNSMFRQAAWHFYYAQIGPWFFCEPDCIPIKKDAFDLIEKEYALSGKPFMGTVMHPTQKDFPDYLNGVAIYPEKAVCEAPSLLQMAEFPNGMEAAFDIVGAKEVLPKAHDSKLFQNVYCAMPEQAPTFPRDAHLIKPETAFFHRNKDGTLMNWMRGKPVADGHGARRDSATRGVTAGNNDEPRDETPVQPSRTQMLEEYERNQTEVQPRSRRKRKRKKPHYSPEGLAKLRINAQKMRDRKMKKLHAHKV